MPLLFAVLCSRNVTGQVPALTVQYYKWSVLSDPVTYYCRSKRGNHLRECWLHSELAFVKYMCAASVTLKNATSYIRYYPYDCDNYNMLSQNGIEIILAAGTMREMNPFQYIVPMMPTTQWRM